MVCFPQLEGIRLTRSWPSSLFSPFPFFSFFPHIPFPLCFLMVLNQSAVSTSEAGSSSRCVLSSITATLVMAFLHSTHRRHTAVDNTQPVRRHGQSRHRRRVDVYTVPRTQCRSSKVGKTLGYVDYRGRLSVHRRSRVRLCNTLHEPPAEPNMNVLLLL